MLEGDELESWENEAQKIQQKMTEFVKMLDYDRYYDFLHVPDEDSLYGPIIEARSNSVWSVIAFAVALESIDLME